MERCDWCGFERIACNSCRNPFNGALDEIRLYDRALSTGEVAYLAGYRLPFSMEQDLNQDGTVDLKDYADLADTWLDEILWPQL